MTLLRTRDVVNNVGNKELTSMYYKAQRCGCTLFSSLHYYPSDGIVDHKCVHYDKYFFLYILVFQFICFFTFELSFLIFYSYKFYIGWSCTLIILLTVADSVGHIIKLPMVNHFVDLPTVFIISSVLQCIDTPITLESI